MISDYLVKCFSELNSSLVNYCILRDYENLPFSFNNDIDILVDETDFKKAINIFIHNSENNIFLIKINSRFGYRGLYFFDKDSNRIFLIDIFFRLQKKWRNYIDSSVILKNKVLFNNFYVIEKNCEIYTICLKELLTYGLVRKKYYDRITNTKIDKKIFKKISKKYLDKKNFSLLYELINTRKIFKISKCLRLKTKYPFFIDTNFYRYCFSYIYSKLKSLISPTPMICLIGPDGVGKSTVSELLKDYLTKSSFFKKVNLYHHRFEYLPALSSFKNQNKTSKLKFDNTRVHSSIRTLIYLVYYTLDYIIGWAQIFKSKIKDEIIIMDRYFYDFYIQNSYSKIPNSCKNIFHLFIPKPIVTIFLYANPRIVFKRKKELTLKQHVIQNKRCLYVLRNLSKNPVFINCTETAESSTKSAFKMIIKKITFEIL